MVSLNPDFNWLDTAEIKRFKINWIQLTQICDADAEERNELIDSFGADRDEVLRFLSNPAHRRQIEDSLYGRNAI